MDLGTLGVQIKWILEHRGTDQINLRTLGVRIQILEHCTDLRTLGVQIKWILEHWGYRSNGSWNIRCTDQINLRTLGYRSN